jgi:hypothetical protein
MRLLATAALLLTVSLATTSTGSAQSFERLTVNGQAVDLPHPAGLIPAPRGPEWESLWQGVGEQMPRIASFMRQGDEEWWRSPDHSSGDYPVSAYVLWNRALMGRSLNTADFQTITSSLRDQATRTQVQEKMQKEFGKTVGEPNIQVVQPTISEPFVDTSKVYAFSSVGALEANGFSLRFGSAAAMVHVRGTILWLYVSRPESELEIAKQQVHAWAEGVLAANPVSVTERVADTVPLAVGSGRIQWDKVVRSAVQGGLVAGLTGLAVSWFRRRDKTQG